MSEEHKASRKDRVGGDPLYPERVEQGYQPRAKTPLDVRNLKPPRGDTAAKPPVKPQAKDPN